MMLSSASAERSRRRCHSNRHTVAAAARFSDSARPVWGTRTLASAAATMSSGRPCASLPNTNMTGPARSARYRSTAPCDGHGQDAGTECSPARDGIERAGAAHHRQVEDRARGGAHGLRVVDIDRRLGEHHGARPGRVGRSQHGTRVPRVADLVQQRHAALVGPQCRRQRGLEIHVEEGGHADQRLRGDGGGESSHDAVGDVVRLDARSPRAHRQWVGVVGREERQERAGVERLGDRLRPFDQEAGIGLAQGAFAQTDGARDLGVAGRRQHGAPRPLGLRPRRTRPWPARRGPRTRPDRARPCRPGSCDRARCRQPSGRA